MSRFVSKELVKIDLGNEEWVKVKKQVPFVDLQPILASLDQDNEIQNIKMAIPLLELAIDSWNLKDEAGETVEFTKDAIKLLDTKTVIVLTTECATLYFPQKKT